MSTFGNMGMTFNFVQFCTVLFTFCILIHVTQFWPGDREASVGKFLSSKTACLWDQIHMALPWAFCLSPSSSSKPRWIARMRSSCFVSAAPMDPCLAIAQWKTKGVWVPSRSVDSLPASDLERKSQGIQTQQMEQVQITGRDNWGALRNRNNMEKTPVQQGQCRRSPGSRRLGEEEGGSRLLTLGKW